MKRSDALPYILFLVVKRVYKNNTENFFFVSYYQTSCFIAKTYPRRALVITCKLHNTIPEEVFPKIYW